MENCFFCPISKAVMINPYVDNEGNSYEYASITEWLKYNQTSPITRNPLMLSQLTPNRALKEIIESKTSPSPLIQTFKREDKLITKIVSTKTTIDNDNYFKIFIRIKG